MANEPSYATYPLIDTHARLDAIKALSPEVRREIEKRFKRAHVLPIETLARNWPEAEHRLLQDGERARLGPLRFGH